MGFELLVEPYCEDCGDIRPVANSFVYSDGTVISISCEYRDKCARMYRHFENRLKKQMEKEGEEE